MSEKCFYCDEPATKYCDHNIGGPIGGYVREGPISANRFSAYFSIDEMPYRCDMPMCDAHATKIGNVFMSGHNDTIDCCPEHVGKDDSGRLPCTEEESHVIRRQIRSAAYHRLMRERSAAILQQSTATVENSVDNPG